MSDKKLPVVCHVTRSHGRYDTRIFHKQCKSLAKAGYKVVLTVCDEFPNESLEDVHIHSIGYRPITRHKIMRFVITLKKLRYLLNQVNADLYHFHDPELLSLALYFKRRGKYVVFDSHEDVPEQLRGSRRVPKWLRKIRAEIYERYEARVARRIDAVISVTPKIVTRFRRLNENSIFIANYPIIDMIDPNEKLTPDRTLCFAGGVGSYYHHEEIITAIQDIQDVRYILAGRASEEYLNRLKQMQGWRFVEYHGVVLHSEVRDLYRMSRIGLAIHKSAQAGKEGSLGVNKVFEYMAAGLPVICSNHLLWKQIMEEEDCGIAINPDDVNEIRTSIISLLDDYESCVRMGNNGREAVKKKYNWNLHERSLLDLYEQLLQYTSNT